LNKKILILAITASLIIIPIPFAEGSMGWLQEIGFGGIQVVEVSDTWVLPASGETINRIVACDPSDYLLAESRVINLFPPQEFGDNVQGSIIPAQQQVGNAGLTKVGGLETSWFTNGGTAVTVEMSMLCVQITGVSSIGGLLLQPDTTALFLAYGIANAVWMAPLAIGIGAGVYLTKSKWKRN